MNCAFLSLHFNRFLLWKEQINIILQCYLVMNQGFVNKRIRKKGNSLLQQIAKSSKTVIQPISKSWKVNLVLPWPQERPESVEHSSTGQWPLFLKDHSRNFILPIFLIPRAATQLSMIFSQLFVASPAFGIRKCILTFTLGFNITFCLHDCISSQDALAASLVRCIVSSCGLSPDSRV